MFDSLTLQLEENLPLAVLLPHGRRQVADVPAAVSARQVVQTDAVGLIQHDQRIPQICVIVPVGHTVGEISGQKAAETGRPLLATSSEPLQSEIIYYRFVFLYNYFRKR